MVELRPGNRVLVRGNEYDEPTQEGVFRGWYTHEKSGDDFPLIQIGEETHVHLGVIFPYHEGLKQFLNSLPNKEAWELSRDISITIQIIKCRNRGK